MKHVRPLIISLTAVILLLCAVIVTAAILRERPIIAPASMATEDRIARIGAVILRTKLRRLSDEGIYLQLKMQGEELLGIEKPAMLSGAETDNDSSSSPSLSSFSALSSASSSVVSAAEE